jgi:hypothetical protein
MTGQHPEMYQQKRLMSKMAAEQGRATETTFDLGHDPWWGEYLDAGSQRRCSFLRRIYGAGRAHS